jgi:hypothetical protein
MDKKILTIILAVVLIGCFFLPYYSLGGINVSGYDSIFNGVGSDWQKYIPLLIPISGAMLLIGALNNGNYVIARVLWALIPLLTILYWLIGSPLINGVAIGDIFKGLGKGFGIGLWVTIGASLVLAVYNPRSKAK